MGIMYSVCPDRTRQFPSENGPFSKSRRQSAGLLVRSTAHAGSFGTSMPPAWPPFRAVREVPKYDSAETLAFLESIKNLLVSASGTALFLSGVSGWEQAGKPEGPPAA